MKRFKLLLTLVFVLLTFGCEQKQNDIYTVESIPLSNYIEEKIISSSFSSEIYKIWNEHIFGSIYNSDLHPILYGTTELFSYNFKNEKITFYDMDTSGRILDFIIMDNTMYYIIVNESENGTFFLSNLV